MTSRAEVVRTLMQNLRDACLDAYASIEGAPLPIPSPVLHHDGGVVVTDCPDLLIVRCLSITSAFQGPPEACAVVMVANLEVTVTRCVPNLTDWGNAASRTDLTEAAESLATDASVLWAGVIAQCQQGLLWAGFDELGCADTKFREMRPGASGGFGWWSWPISVNVTAALTGGNDPIVWVDSGDDEILWES